MLGDTTEFDKLKIHASLVDIKEDILNCLKILTTEYQLGKWTNKSKYNLFKQPSHILQNFGLFLQIS